MNEGDAAAAEVFADRRRRAEDITSTWVRWAVAIMLGLVVSALGFIVQLSNRMTAVEVKVEAVQQQRAELSASISDLRSQIGQLNVTITRLNEQLQQLEPVRHAPAVSGRMFDK